MRVAIQGEMGSFSHEAARKFVAGSRVVACATSAAVFRMLAASRVDSALIPIENSLAGPVAVHLDLLVSNRAFIQREFRLRIRHTLQAAPGVRFEAIRKVYSHPIALEQCRDFFRSHPRLHPESFYDTAGSVKHVVANQIADAAAIASAEAAGVYGARILKRSLEDDKQNYTRFVLIGRDERVMKNANKTSIAFALKNQPGALFKALSVFALRDIDLSKIESRPIRGRPWEYVFFVDLLRGRDQAAAKALEHLREIADFVKVLGVYPRA